MPLSDTRGRALRDLRVSLTDRCNFRCGYCMPREVFGPGFAFLPPDRLLSFDEIATIVGVFVRHGVTKVRLTGGEPLLRPAVPDLVARLTAMAGVQDLALTTNGALLADHAAALRAAGLHRVTVSLDSLDDATFRRLGDVALPLSRVLDGIAAAGAAGFPPVKLNTVVRRGENDRELRDLAAFARSGGHEIRFIEYMDVGASNGWRRDEVVPAAEIVERITDAYPAEPLEPVDGQVAERWRYLDGGGTFGIVASVTQPFCSSCVRARLSAAGELFTCLFATRGRDLVELVRSGSLEELDAVVASVWGARTDRYSEIRGGGRASDDRVEMSYIGG